MKKGCLETNFHFIFTLMLTRRLWIRTLQREFCEQIELIDHLYHSYRANESRASWASLFRLHKIQGGRKLTVENDFKQMNRLLEEYILTWKHSKHFKHHCTCIKLSRFIKKGTSYVSKCPPLESTAILFVTSSQSLVQSSISKHKKVFVMDCFKWETVLGFVP